MENEILDNLILIGQFYEHRTAKMLNGAAEFVNETNKITAKIKNDKELQITYIFFNQTKLEVVPSALIYEFFEELLKRKDANKISLRYGISINVHEWKEQLRPSLLKIENEKDYNRYLKHIQLTSERFHVEYFDGIVILKDKEKELLNNVLMLKNALQQSV